MRRAASAALLGASGQVESERRQRVREAPGDPELLRAQPRADDSLTAVEEAPDHELEARATMDLADREDAATEP